MKPIENLERMVCDLYEERRPERDSWSDWLYANHVIIVADYATELAPRFGAKADLTRAGALLHDIADSVMPRLADPEAHERRSLEIARELMKTAGFSGEEVALVVEDAIRYHSCHGDERPVSIEGKVLSTADSLAHLQTDFYAHAVWAFGHEDKTLEFFKTWFAKKIERDYHIKIQFDEIREECREKYEMLKAVFAR